MDIRSIKSFLVKSLASDSVKLVLALLAVFFLFVLAIGAQKGLAARAENQKVLAELNQAGAPAAKPARDNRLQDPWREGWDGAMRFLSGRNLETIARQTTIVGLAALGMTLVIIAGGIDLSVGSAVALATIVIAWFLGRMPSPSIAAILAVATCALFGLLSGLAITRLRVVPFIVTLGMMLLVRGAAKGLSHEQKIDAPETWLNGLLASLLPEQRWMLVPVGVWVLIAMAILTALVLRYTKLGRHAFALGSNEQTARLCGVAVDRVKLGIYTLCGAFAGLAGVMQFSRLTVGDPTVANGLELDVIAAVVIGGGSLSGGEGSVLGSLAGALIMTVIRSGCSQMGMPNWVQEIITGIIIIAAVALDRLRHRRSAE
jgi:ribose/xylose/arabinose/galactoside ABC-type transport system permease subunit